MTELYPSDASLNALSGTADPEQQVHYPAIGESPYYTSFYKMLHRLLNVSRRAGDLRVYQDGPLSFGVRAGQFADGDTVTSYAGSSGNALTEGATNHIYLTAGGVLTVSTVGFPDPSAEPHIPLATIATAAGGYAQGDIVDCRGRALLHVNTALSAGLANDVAGFFGNTGGQALQDLLPGVSFSIGQESGDVREVVVQLRDAEGQELAQRFRVRVWLAESDFGAPSAAGNTVAVTAGTVLRTITAHADYELITGADGSAGLSITVTGSATRYVLAEVDGRIYSSGPVTWNV